MIFWKVDTKKNTIRQVEGERLGRDNEGDTCNHGFHYTSPEDALARLESHAGNMLIAAGKNVESLRKRLQQCESDAGDAAVAYSNVAAMRRTFELEGDIGKNSEEL